MSIILCESFDFCTFDRARVPPVFIGASVRVILAGKTIEAAPASELPPSGPPGIKGRRLHAFVEKAIKALETGDNAAALKSLRDGMERYNRSE
jgi:hypothetical protein